jgi:hypothetical protein
MATIGAIAAVLGAGASLYGAASAGGGVINGNQNDISYRNYYLNRMIQRQQQEMARASRVDARGNRMDYIDGYGWRETPTAETAANNRAADAELRQQLTADAVRNRIGADNAAQRQLLEGNEAEALLRQFGRGNETRGDVQALLGNKLVAEAASGKDDMRRRIGMQSLRSGGGSEALAALGRRSMPDTRTALATAALDAGQLAEQRSSARNSNTLNQYNLLAGRAAAPVGSTINPASIPNNSAQALGNASFAGIQALSGAKNSAPQLAGIQADPTSGRWAAAGDTIQGLAENPYIQQALSNWMNNDGSNGQKPTISRTRQGSWSSYD